MEPLFLVLDFLWHGMHIAFSRVELLFEGFVGSLSCPLRPFVICSVRLHWRSRLPPYCILYLTSSGESLCKQVLTHCVFHATLEFKTKYRNPVQGVYDCYHCTEIVVKPSRSQGWGTRRCHWRKNTILCQAKPVKSKRLLHQWPCWILSPPAWRRYDFSRWGRQGFKKQSKEIEESLVKGHNCTLVGYSLTDTSGHYALPIDTLRE